MSSKRQQTFAKMERERRVRERRALKMEKKQAAAAERMAQSAEDPSAVLAVGADDPEGVQPVSAEDPEAVQPVDSEEDSEES